MAMITFLHKGQFYQTKRFFKVASDINDRSILQKYAERGLAALASATPKKTGLTSSSWSYKIQHVGDGVEIVWSNSNVNDGFHIAIGLQFGHGTGWGGYVRGIDYINPAIQPVFEAMVEELWSEVTRA